MFLKKKKCYYKAIKKIDKVYFNCDVVYDFLNNIFESREMFTDTSRNAFMSSW